MVADDALGGQQHAGDAGSVLQSDARHLHGVDDTRFEQVLVNLGAGVEAEVVLAFLHLVDHDRAFQAGVLNDLAQRLFQGALDDGDTRGLVLVVALQLLDGLDGADETDTAARDDTLFDGSAGGVQSVLNAVFLLLHLDLRGGTHIDDCHATGQLGQALLQLLAVVVARGGLDLGLDLVGAGLDVALGAVTVHDGGVVLVDAHLVGLTEHLQGGVFKLVALLFADDGATGQDGDVFQHFLTTVAEARSLDGSHFQRATQTVDDQGSQGLAVDVLSDDDEGATGLQGLFEHGQQILHHGDLLVVDQDVRILVDGFHFLGVGDEVRRDVATVELHTFDDVDVGVDAFGVLNGDHAFLLHLAHSLGDEATDGAVVVGRNGGHLLDLLIVAVDLHRHLLQRSDHCGNSLVDTTLQVERVGAGGDVLQTRGDDGLGQHGGGGGTITSQVVGLGGHFLHELGTHVFDGVDEFDFLGDRHTVLGDLGSAIRFFDDHVTTFGAEGHLHCV